MQHASTTEHSTHHWLWGLVGIFALILMVSGTVASGIWLYANRQPQQELIVRYAAPTAKDAEVARRPATENAKPPKIQTAKVIPLVPVPQSSVSVVQPNTQQNAPDIALSSARNLPTGDRDRLANALFEVSQLLDQENALFYRCNTEGARLDAIGKAVPLSPVSTHTKALCTTYPRRPRNRSLRFVFFVTNGNTIPVKSTTYLETILIMTD
jgi:hypothetical protein